MNLILKFIIVFIIFGSIQKLYSQKPESMLQRAYKQKSDSMLVAYFAKWEHDTISNKKTDLDLEVNNVFQMFFDPENISKVSGLSNWDSIYSNVKYYILQSNISIHKVKSDSLQKSGIYNDSLLENYEINNFRPVLNLKNKKILFLTEGYETELYQFLGKPGKSALWRNNPKMNFISTYIKVFPATDNSWFFETRPIVSDIYFNRTQKIARIDFRLFFQEGSAYFIKDHNQWKMIWSGIVEY